MIVLTKKEIKQSFKEPGLTSYITLAYIAHISDDGGILYAHRLDVIVTTHPYKTKSFTEEITL